MRWFVIFAAWYGLGMLIGWLLDSVLVEISHHYIYPPHAFGRRFSTWSLLAAAVIAAIATAGRAPTALFAQVLRLAVVCFAVSWMSGIAWGAGAVWLVQRESPSSVRPKPMRRQVFCDGLWRGTAIGFAMGTAGCAYWLSRSRRRRDERTAIRERESKTHDDYLRVLLIDTAAPDRPGSMVRYATLLETALRSVPGLEIRRISLAPTARQLQSVPRRFRMAAHHGIIAWRAARIAQSNPADLYHVLDGSHGYVVRSLPRARTIVTVHDIIPKLQADGDFPLPPPGIAARWLVNLSLRGAATANRIVAISQSTANDLSRRARVSASKIAVVPLALLPDLLPDAADSTPDWIARSSVDAPFLLHVGNNGFYKNRSGVVRIFHRLRQRMPIRLKLAGPPPDSSLRSLIRERQLDGDIDFIIDPTDAEIVALYRTARLLLFPSLYEGFGWPPLEAMAWGCPVVASGHGSLAEIVGDAALIAPAAAEEKLAEHCLEILTSNTQADRLTANGFARVDVFSLDRFRERMVAVYRQIKATDSPPGTDQQPISAPLQLCDQTLQLHLVTAGTES